MLKQCHIFDENPTGLRTLWNTAVYVRLLNDGVDFHLLITTYWHLIYCHLHIYYFGTFNVNERSRWKTLEREGHKRGFCWYSRCAYLWWEWRLILVYANECCRDFIDEYLIKALRSKPMFKSDHHQSDIIKDTLTEQHITGLIRTLRKCPENIFFCPARGAKANLLSHISERESTDIFFSRGINYFNDTRSASMQKSTAYLEDNPSASPLCKSNVRWRHIHPWAGGDELDCIWPS